METADNTQGTGQQQWAQLYNLLLRKQHDETKNIKTILTNRPRTMPGAIIHLITGSVLYLIGRFSFRSFFKDNQKLRKNLLLATVCISFSLLPDFFLGIYYLTHIEPASVLMPYQTFTHLQLTPIAIGLLIPIVLLDAKRRPIWIMGTTALILHIIMDLYILETNYLW